LTWQSNIPKLLILLAAPAVAAILFNVRISKGHTMMADQLNYLTRLDKQLRDGKPAPDASTARKLLHSFHERDVVSFVNIMFHKDHGLLLLTNKRSLEYKNFSLEDRLYHDNRAKIGTDGWRQVVLMFAAEEAGIVLCRDAP
jgi:hypothetical protein